MHEPSLTLQFSQYVFSIPYNRIYNMTLVCDKAGAAVAALKICSLRRTSSDGNTYDDENVCNDDDANEYINVVRPPSATIYLIHKAICGLWSIVQDVAWEIGLLPMDDNIHTLLSSYVDSLNLYNL